MPSTLDRDDPWLAEWHRIVAEKDLPALEGLLALDIELGAPPYWDKLKGRPMVHHLLGLIIHTIEDFTYHREWCAYPDEGPDEGRKGGEYALEFTGHVAEHNLQGIDLISVDTEGVIQRFEVLMRPVNTVIELRNIIAPKMAEFLGRKD